MTENEISAIILDAAIAVHRDGGPVCLIVYEKRWRMSLKCEARRRAVKWMIPIV
jgi:hypothetical protein